MSLPVAAVVDAVADSAVAPTTALATSVNKRVTSLAIVPMSRLWTSLSRAQRRSLKKKFHNFLRFSICDQEEWPTLLECATHEGASLHRVGMGLCPANSSFVVRFTTPFSSLSFEHFRSVLIFKILLT